MQVKIRAVSDFALRVPFAIVGGGACGLTAALAAHAAGLAAEDVWVLERDATPSGSTGMSYGAICAAGTNEQARTGIDDTAAALFADIMTAARHQTDPALAQLLATRSGPAVDWLIDTLGLPLSVMTNWTGLGHRVPRLHAPASRSGRDLMGMLQRAMEAAGLPLVTEARVDTLYTDDSGTRITGIAVDRRGDREELGCDALLLACCGFGGNPALIARYIPEMAQSTYYGHEGNTGDAVLWGEALGAAMADLGSYQGLGSLAVPHHLVVPHTLLIGGGVQINTLGERFEDELANISGQALDILAQPGACCWVIYDQRLHEAALTGFQEYRDGAAVGAFRRADSIEALAAQTQLPLATLGATLHEVAAHKAAGTRDRFGRDFAGVAQLEPPYYAVKVTGAIFHTQGGLCIDDHARVRRVGDGIFANLYAGGGAARSVSGPGIWGYLPGMGLCTAVTLGHVAGQAAAHALTHPASA